ncbi:MAG: PilZ domain-containing protein [Candidatus Eremiobacteraeota bacterium]|nr:PilZ domain-containing protein [Candidatus Eremiobacteraeota bacterium]
MSSDGIPSHQRQFYRAPVDFPVTLESAGLEPLAARAVDLSGGGIRVAASEQIPSGETVTLRFRLPNTVGEMMVRGRAVLSFYEAKSVLYQHGIAFTQVASIDREAIVRFIHELQRRSLRDRPAERG